MSQPDDKTVVVLRVLEYIGSRAWVSETLKNSQVPPQGSVEFSSGGRIRSGLVLWTAKEAT